MQRTPRIGQRSAPFDELTFCSAQGLRGWILEKFRFSRLPVLFNILKGDMSFVGPLPMSPDGLNLSDWRTRKRNSVPPGLISLWWIRQRASIDYGSELDVDLEYVDNHGLRTDVGICLRAIPAILFGSSVRESKEEMSLWGIRINNYTMEESLEAIQQWLGGEQGKQVCFVNADCANIAYRNQEYLEVLKKADLCLADGIGLKLAGKLLDREIVQNVNGTDMFPLLCERLAQTDRKVFLLGARPEVVEGLLEWIRNGYPLLDVCGWQHGYFNPAEESGIVQKIKDSGAHLLFVAFGSPRQDLWIHEHLGETGVNVAIGVGGLFDFYSGRIERAPLWMREIGMEWLFRLLQEPGRLWKRYLIGNGLFLGRVIKERFLPAKRN